jgi:hypothetical protein
VGVLVDKVAMGEVFFKYFGFPYQLSFHQMFHTHLSSGAGTTGQLVADVPSGLSLNQHNEINKKKRTTEWTVFWVVMPCIRRVPDFSEEHTSSIFRVKE